MKAGKLAATLAAVDPELEILVEFDEGDFMDLTGGGVRKAVFVVWDDGSAGWWPAPLVAINDTEDLDVVVESEHVRTVLVLTTMEAGG